MSGLGHSNWGEGGFIQQASGVQGWEWYSPRSRSAAGHRLSSRLQED